MNLDMDEMIADCEAKKRDGETIAFAIGAGRVVPVLGKGKAMKKARKLIEKQDGFLGFHLVDLWHTLLIYDSLNNAKGARNVLTAAGIELGQVVPILVPKEFESDKT